jgi:hypothetical protein
VSPDEKNISAVRSETLTRALTAVGLPELTLDVP